MCFDLCLYVSLLILVLHCTSCLYQYFPHTLIILDYITAKKINLGKALLVEGGPTSYSPMHGLSEWRYLAPTCKELHVLWYAVDLILQLKYMYMYVFSIQNNIIVM